MFDKLNIEDNTTYECLITTNSDKSYSTKPFGVIFENDMIVLKLYPNNTLNNIKNNNSFIIQLSSNPLTYTKALFNQLSADDYDENYILKASSLTLSASVVSFSNITKMDKYGNNTVTVIVAKIDKIISKKNSYPTINRSTNKIMELLVKASRINYMSDKEYDYFKKQIHKTYEFILKEGNKVHIDSIKLIKKELKID